MKTSFPSSPSLRGEIARCFFLRACIFLLPAFLFAQTPTLSTISPSSANNTASVAVTITGTNLGTTTIVRLSGPATRDITGSDIIQVNATSIVAIFPLNLISTGLYTVSTVNAQGTSSSNTLPFRSTSGAPQITQVIPTSGSNNADHAVDLVGNGFAGVSQVQIKGPITRDLTFLIVSSTRLTVTFPSGLAGGTYSIQATSSSGPSNDDIHYVVNDVATQSTLSFSDSSGNVKSSYVLATDGVFVTVVDADRDTDSTTQQTFNVTVTDSSTNDLELLTLTETTTSSGVFRNVTGLTTNQSTATQRNGILESQPGSTLTAQYRDPIFGDTATGSAVSIVTSTSSATQFTDSSGGSTSSFDITVDRIYVTVHDASRNLDSLISETVRVTLTDPTTADRETLTLMETGINTGVFRNASPGISSSRSFISTAGNANLETLDSSVARVDYTDPTQPTDTSFATATMHDRRPSSISFTSGVGTAVTSYTIGVDSVFVTVTDPSMDRNLSLAERLSITITSSSTGDSETVELVETGVSTGIFRNQSGITSHIAMASSNGLLDLSANATATAHYADPYNSTDQVTATSTFRVASTVSEIRFSDTNGSVKQEYRIGTEPVFVTLSDSDQNRSASVSETVNVTLVDTQKGDVESVRLTETGSNTGVFRNATGITSSLGNAVLQDEVIQTQDWSTVTANYKDPDDSSDQSETIATMRVTATSTTPSLVAFTRSVGSSTTTAEFQIAVDPIVVRVVDPDQCKDQTTIETVRVTLTNRQTHDEETATLTEVDLSGTPSANGVRFETQTGLSSRIGLPIAGNGTIEASANSTLTATYLDPDDSTDRVSTDSILKSAYTSPTITFTDQGGTKVSGYQVGDATGVYVTVTDSQANLSASTSVRDTVVTSVYDLTTGDIVSLTLLEIPDVNGVYNTGIFRNSPRLDSLVGLPPSEITTVLYTAHNAAIVANYTKAGMVTDPSFPTTQTYDPTIARILASKRGPNGLSCFDCHSDDNYQAQLNLTGYRDLRRGGDHGDPIVSGNAQTSRIVQMLETTSVNPLAQSHTGGKVGQIISQSDLNRLKAWINEGAVPPTTPTSVVYDTIQSQIFTPSCVNRPSPTAPGCHDSSYQAGGIRLDSQAGFLAGVTGRSAAKWGDGPNSRMVQVLTDSTLIHSGRKTYVTATDPLYLSTEKARMLSEYLSQQYLPWSTSRPPLREYTSDVQPYFDRNCTLTGCHNRKDLAGKLDLTTYQGLMRGGLSGACVSPGNVPHSKLTSMLDATISPTHTAGITQAAPSFFSSRGPTVITSWMNQGAFPGQPGEISGPPNTGVSDRVTMTVGPSSATIAFTDAAGAPISFYKIEDDGIYITVTDSDQHKDPTTSETIVVDLVDSRTSDTERVTLTTIHVNSSTFRNRSPIRSVVGSKVNYDGIVQTVNDSQLKASFTDPTFPETVSTTTTMSTNTRSSVRFIDSLGLPVGQVFITLPVRLEVTDNDQSGKGRLEAGSVTLGVTSTSDSERLSLVMSEITTRPGTFRSQALSSTNQVTATVENGRVELTYGATLFVSYTDPSFTTDTVTATALARMAPTSSQVDFTDTYGTTQSSFVARVDNLFVTVRDADRNLDPNTTDTVSIRIVNDQISDQETVTLAEIGRDSGVFRNRTGVPIKISSTPNVGNGILEVADNGVASVLIHADYSDDISPPDSKSAYANVQVASQAVLQFTDVNGTLVSRYVRATNLIYLTLTDEDLNRNTTVAETVAITVTDPSISPGDRETLTLVETDKSTGIFRNTQGLSSVFGWPVAIPENKILESRVNSVAVPGQVIYARYVDPYHPSEVVNATAEMTPKDPSDSDDDGMIDSWENRYGLNPLDPTDANLDFDSDGWTNIEEYREGTNPCNPWDHKPTADPGSSRSVDPGVIQLDGSASGDPRSRPLTYRWTQVNVGQTGHGPAVTLSDPNAVCPTFLGFGGRTSDGIDLSLFDFDLVVTNERVSSSPGRVEITVNNVPPSPFAGIDQAVLVGESIILNGRESADANNETSCLTYAWSRPSGSGTFNGTTEAPVVVPTIVGTYPFDLTCTDPANNSATSRVYVMVHSSANHVPLASVSSPIASQVGATIVIDGSASADADSNDILLYHWRVTKTPSGAGALSTLPPDSSLSKTNFVAPRSGYYEIQLTVSDSSGNCSPPVTAAVVVDFPGSGTQSPNRVPTAVVSANMTAMVSSTITLDGRASKDPDGSSLTYRWTQFRGVKVSLSGNTSASPSFIPFWTGVYGFHLVVSDGTNESAPATVFVTVNQASQHIPVANAGSDLRTTLANGGTSVVLDGRASSDVENDRLTYYWRQVSGPGVALSNRESSRPVLTTSQFGTYVFDLTVYDQKRFSLPSRTTVLVNPSGIGEPVANPGSPQTIYYAGAPMTVHLDGTQSTDPQGLPLSYAWTQIAGPTVALSPGADSPTPSFEVSAIGAYKFSLVVRNSRSVTSLPAIAVVTVVEGSNQPPMIRVNGSGGATATIKTQGGMPVTLDASASWSPGGGTMTFVWQQISGPGVLIRNPSTATPSFTPVAAGTYVFSVLAVDSRSNQGTGTVTVFVGTDSPTISTASDSTLSGTAAGSAGGGGGGCRAGRASSSETISPGGWIMVLALWIGLAQRRLSRKTGVTRISGSFPRKGQASS